MTKEDMRRLEREKKKKGLKSARSLTKKKRGKAKPPTKAPIFKDKEEALRWISNKPFQPTVRMVEGIGENKEKKNVAALGIDLTFVIYAKDITMITERARKLWDILVEIDKEFLKETNLREIIADDFQSEA